MRKTLLHKLFGIGRIPKQVRPALEKEQILVFDEGLRGSVTYRNYRAPGKRFVLRRVWFTGSVVITNTRVAAFAYSREIINLTFDNPRLGKLDIKVERSSVLCIAFDARDFKPGQSGRVEFRFKTEKAVEFANYFRVTA